MKENIYDDEDFFRAYSNFPRSVEGLRAAGEWHALEPMLGPLAGKRVLDIGCGMGWHCFYAAGKGASFVLGTDISEKMLTVARGRNCFPNVEFVGTPMEDLTLPAGSFDVVLSSLAFHYTDDFKGIATRVFRWLSPGGSFIFTVEHPVFTASGKQCWVETTLGQKVWPVDNYFTEGERTAEFLDHRVVKYHRTLTSYIRTLLRAGFIIKDLEEPQPAQELLEANELMQEELRRPMMLIISAAKPTGRQC